MEEAAASGKQAEIKSSLIISTQQFHHTIRRDVSWLIFQVTFIYIYMKNGLGRFKGGKRRRRSSKSGLLLINNYE